MLNGYFFDNHDNTSIWKINGIKLFWFLSKKMKVTQEIQISKSENEIELGRIFKNLNTLR